MENNKLNKGIRVAVMGFGAMGKEFARLVEMKRGLKLECIISRNRERWAEGIEEGFSGELFYENIVDAFDETSPQLVLHATGSFIREVYPQLRKLLSSGVDVITIAEEMAYPFKKEPDLIAELEEICRKNRVTLLGTGINPGFVLDLLIITLTGTCKEVERIEAKRVNDLSPFGPTVMRGQGVGTTAEQFEEGIKNGEIVGHVGFPESIEMIGAALGVNLTRVEEDREPIVSNTTRETRYVKIEPGLVAGCNHVARGYTDKGEFIVLEHPQQIMPEVEGVSTGDFIKIKGIPDINMSIEPEIPGGIGTCSLTVNMIPQVFSAMPGVVSMKDLPVPAAISNREKITKH